MAARSSRWICALLIIGFTLPGCASTGCGWWGRNSDCSSSVGNKSVNPTQSGPLAGTYTRPGNGMMTSPQQSSNLQGTNQNTPVVTSSPAQAMPSSNMPQTNSLNFQTPSSPLNSNAAPSGYQPQNSAGPQSFNTLSRPEMKSAVDVNIPAPTIPTPNIPSPTANYALPATTVSGSGQPAPATTVSQPTPMMFAPPAGPSPVKLPPTSAPSVPMPTVAPPINLQIDTPAGSVSLPPPIAPPPTPPSFDGK